MTVNYHRQNYSHCTPRGLLASQKRKTDILKFVCFLTTVYLETRNIPLLQTLRFQALLLKKVLNCGIQIGMTYNVIKSTIEATLWYSPREGISLRMDVMNFYWETKQARQRVSFCFCFYIIYLFVFSQQVSSYHRATYLVSDQKTKMHHTGSSTCNTGDTSHFLGGLRV